MRNFLKINVTALTDAEIYEVLKYPQETEEGLDNFIELTAYAPPVVLKKVQEKAIILQRLALARAEKLREMETRFKKMW